jgi:hypothetical protein
MKFTSKFLYIFLLGIIIFIGLSYPVFSRDEVGGSRGIRRDGMGGRHEGSMEGRIIEGRANNQGIHQGNYREEQNLHRYFPRGYNHCNLRNGRKFYYHNGLFFRWIDTGFVVVEPPYGEVIATLPSGYISFKFGNFSYYYLDGVYYKSVPDGYVIVPETEIENYRKKSNKDTNEIQTQQLLQSQTTTQSQIQQQQSINEYSVNIPNTDGTYTVVKLTKSGNGYTGPQGEFYDGHPTVEQLKILYGK